MTSNPFQTSAKAILLAFIAMAMCPSAPAAEIRVLSAIGMRQVMLKLGPEFERTSGHTLSLAYDSGAVIVKRILAGEAADVVLIPRAGIEQLAQAGRIAAGPIDLATSRVGLAVRTGARKPDISSPAAFKRALLEAKTIALPDPALGGSSGVHLARVLQQLGIAEAVRDKLVLSSTPQDALTLPGARVAAGRAEIALHQMQELKAVAGLVIVGPLPDDLQEVFVFSAAIVKGTKPESGAQGLVDFLLTAAARDAIHTIGMTPVWR
jgi:molybdate transport system substrate-binding protein